MNDPYIIKKVLKKVLNEEEMQEVEEFRDELPEFRIKLVYLGAKQRYLRQFDLL
jgi:hypothetical protein